MAANQARAALPAAAPKRARVRSQHVHLALEDSRSASFQVGLEPEDVGSEEGDEFDEEASYVESDDSIASGQEEPEDESEGEDKGEGSSSTDSTSDSSSDDDEEKGEEGSESEIGGGEFRGRSRQ